MILYVIVRKDLTSSQQAVQAGHAVAEYLLENPVNWKNETLIYLGVKGLAQLENIKRKLKFQNINYIEWKEPDLNNETTAIASDRSNKIFKKLNLL
jgi:hypothetical protein